MMIFPQVNELLWRSRPVVQVWLNQSKFGNLTVACLVADCGKLSREDIKNAGREEPSSVYLTYR